MPEYWLDADSLIETNKGPYSFDIVPSFWVFLEEQIAKGVIASSIVVYDELEEGDEDDLLLWARKQKKNRLFIEPDAIVQNVFRQIADYINENYPQHHASKFLNDADPWLISHAKSYGGRVVTFEKSAPDGKKPKIPDIGDIFNVKTKNIYEMVKELGMSL